MPPPGRRQVSQEEKAFINAAREAAAEAANYTGQPSAAAGASSLPLPWFEKPARSMTVAEIECYQNAIAAFTMLNPSGADLLARRAGYTSRTSALGLDPVRRSPTLSGNRQSVLELPRRSSSRHTSVRIPRGSQIVQNKRLADLESRKQWTGDVVPFAWDQSIDPSLSQLAAPGSLPGPNLNLGPWTGKAIPQTFDQKPAPSTSHPAVPGLHPILGVEHEASAEARRRWALQQHAASSQNDWMNPPPTPRDLALPPPGPVADFSTDPFLLDPFLDPTDTCTVLAHTKSSTKFAPLRPHPVHLGRQPRKPRNFKVSKPSAKARTPAHLGRKIDKMDPPTNGHCPYEDMFRLQYDQDEGWGFGQTSLTCPSKSEAPVEETNNPSDDDCDPSSPDVGVALSEIFNPKDVSPSGPVSSQPTARSKFADITPTAVDFRLPADTYPVFFDNAFHDTLAANQAAESARSKLSSLPPEQSKASASASQPTLAKSSSSKRNARPIPPAGKVSAVAYDRAAYDEEFRDFVRSGINNFSSGPPGPEVQENPKNESIFDDVFLEFAQDVTTGIYDRDEPTHAPQPAAGPSATAAQQNDEDDPLMTMFHEAAASIAKYGVGPEAERRRFLDEHPKAVAASLPSYVTDIRRIYGAWASKTAYIDPLMPDGSTFDAKVMLKTEIIQKRIQWMTDSSRKSRPWTRSRVPSVGLSVQDRTKRERHQRLGWQYVAADEMLMQGVKGIGHDSAGQEKLVVFVMGGDSLFTVLKSDRPKQPLTGYCKKLAVYQKREGAQGDEYYWLGVAGDFTGQEIPEATIGDRCQIVDMQSCMDHVMSQREWDQLRYSWEDRENFNGIPLADEEEENANQGQTIHPKDLMKWPSLNVLGPMGWNALEYLWSDILEERVPAKDQQGAQTQGGTSGRETRTLQEIEDSLQPMELDDNESIQHSIDATDGEDQQDDSEMQDESGSDENTNESKHEISTDSQDDEEFDILAGVEARWEQEARQVAEEMSAEPASSIEASISENVFVTGEEPEAADEGPPSPAESNSSDYSRWSLETTFEPRLSRRFAPARPYHDAPRGQSDP